MDKKTSILLSTYNEAPVIKKTIDEIFKHVEDVEIVVTDDNSNDGTYEIIKAIKRKKKISIVNLSSIVGTRGFSELSAYGSSKGALDAFTKCIAVEFQKNVRINNVCPGFTKTSYYKKFKRNKKLHNWTLKNIPMGRWAETDEISNLIIYLISNKSNYITGQNFYIDGGWTTK